MRRPLLVLAFLLASLRAEEFRAASVTVEGGPFAGRSFRYRVFVPDDVKDGERLPVLLFLHGAGERGDDNEAQLRHLPERMVRPEYRARFRGIVVAPQCARGEMWMKVDWSKPESERASSDSPWLDVALAALRKTIAEEPCDLDRVYLTGLSMGGFGSWHLAARAPELFAAVVPICGGGDPESAAKLATLPIWAWHGGADNVVPPERSRAMVRAVRAAGGTVHYTELPGVGHDSWSAAYALDGVLGWLWARRRGEVYRGYFMSWDRDSPRIALRALDGDAAPRWEWSGEGLTGEQRAWLAATTDVAPGDLGTTAIVSTAAGGVFVVRLADRKVLFQARVDGAIDAVAELPGGALVVASAGRLLRVERSPGAAPRQIGAAANVTRLAWDPRGERLWAVGALGLQGFALDGDALVARDRLPVPGSVIAGALRWP